ncbi:RNA polymerase sigma factor [Stieleria varia]|uniref:RNA polymerase sigma factor n=1 Tax=Stieleria varia TaxID=2528005 RepID=A0A5C6AGV6_9BACT|nr:sigma-70 family RNA polymerase sigma factor [Stieleria varia]TWT98667.1 RNA polymerase sigma factor [Stieleria varia]
MFVLAWHAGFLDVIALTDSPNETRATLLLRLRDGGDSDAWNQFLRDYGPMLYRFVRSRGLQDADAADIVQDVMRRVGTAIGRLEYNKQKGGFRAWLFTITRNRLYTYFEQRSRNSATVNDTAQFELLSQAADTQNELEQQWEHEHMRQLAAVAMSTVRDDVEPSTWLAFQRTAVDGLSATAVAEELKMSTGAIYVAKSRVTAKLRAEVERLQENE